MSVGGRQISARDLGAGRWRVDIELPVQVSGAELAAEADNQTLEGEVDPIADSPCARLETVSAPTPAAQDRWSVVIAVDDADRAPMARYRIRHRGGVADVVLAESLQEPAAPARAAASAAPRDDVDYTARDYDALRSMMLAMVAQRVPGELVGQKASQTVALVEELAYLGDALSYQQDAVATEAYLATARRRISVARHAALLDYRVFEGSSARAWVEVKLAPGVDSLPLPARTKLVTRTPGLRRCLSEAELTRARAQGSLVFETLAQVVVHADVGGTYPVVRDASGGTLAARAREAVVECPEHAFHGGDLVVIEPSTSGALIGQVVRLTHVNRPERPGGRSILHWESVDAPAAESLLTATPVSVRKGNLIPVEHADTLPATPLSVPLPDARYWPWLPQPEPTFSLGPWAPDAHSASGMLFPAGATARPRLRLEEAEWRGSRPWEARDSLFESGALDRHYVVEVESDRRARLRFGDGVNGMEPPVDAGFVVRQCVGNGAVGNVGPGAIAHIVLPPEHHRHITGVANPAAASGGSDPELLSSVRLNAPAAFRVTRRVVAPQDYVREASGVDGVHDATAMITSGGSWPIALVYVHSGDWSPESDRKLIEPVEQRVRPLQPAGVDLQVRAAVPMPVTARLDVTLASGWELAALAEAVDATIQQSFLGMGRFGFGTALHRSELVTVVGALQGVADVWVREFRWATQPRGEAAADSLLPPFGRIISIANDPLHRERGIIDYELRVAAP